MITDPLFYRLFETSPQTFFLLLGMPFETAREMAERYQFQAIEIKETAHRLDGVFLPREQGLPLYFVEVQFYRLPTVYADIAAKAFNYLKQNDPAQEFVGVVLFASRALEPTGLKPYRVLLDGGVIRPFYLDEMEEPANAPVVFSILHLIRHSESEAAERARDLITRVKTEIADDALREDLIELIGTVILYKLPSLSRSEVEAMLQVNDIRESRVYQEALEEGIEKGLEKGRMEGRMEGREEGREKGREEGRMELASAVVPLLAASKMTAEEIAEKLSMNVEEVRKLMDKWEKN